MTRSLCFYPLDWEKSLKNNSFISDFDTGSEIGFFNFDELKMLGIIDLGEFETFQYDYHLNEKYHFIQKKVIVGIQDDFGKKIEKEMSCVFVSNWRNSPFRYINPLREGLCGRDILSEFDFILSLNSSEKKTLIKFN